MDVDAEGSLYVCDHGHDRIAVFDSQGALQQELPVENPIQVAVHPSGKIYVYSADTLPKEVNINSAKLTHRIVRLGGKRNPEREAELVWPDLSARTTLCLALDKQSEPPILWVGTGMSQPAHFWYRGDIRKIIDNGKSLEDLGDVIAGKSPNPDFGRSHKFILVDPQTEEVWWDYFIFDGNTGNLTGKFQNGWPWNRVPIGQPGRFVGEPRLGPDNSVVFWGEKLARYRRDGEPFPFASTGSHEIVIPGFSGKAGRNFSRGIDVDAQGNNYILGSTGFAESKKSGILKKIDKDGRILHANLVEIEESVGGLAVDQKGAIFIGAHVKDYGHPLPAHWESFFKAHPDRTRQNEYEMSTGSVIKFLPSGGVIRADPAGLDFQTSERFFRETIRFKATGVTWTKFVYPVAKAHSGKCNCEVADMEVDGHNRLFVPDPLTYSIWVFDENGNKISRFGEYGNMDSAGPGSKVPVPEIPLAYAFRLAVSDKAVYISDSQAQRVLKVRLDYKENVCISMDGSPGK